MSNNKPLRRGVDGICTRSACECEREGLGDQCVWLKPAESGPHARPMHPDWARSLRDQCEARQERATARRKVEKDQQSVDWE